MTERLTILVEEKGTRVVKRNIKSLGKESKLAGTNVKFLQKALVGIVAAGAVAALTAAAGAAIELKDALAEVSTLLDDTPGEMALLEDATKRLAVEFGSMPVEQARGFYQAISAGASDAAEATEILTAANKLAVGGVTDVFTATDGLTTVLNAYGDQVESATAVSDALFIAMRAGKTTIGELSSSLGKVAPLAAQAGVGFDELVSSIAALTKGGISTQESITGVRAILAAIVKPTSEAAKLAQSLGLEFNAAALESKGLAGFLADLTEKTGGSTEVMAQLFGGVEALVPVLALSGAAGEDFVNILADMADKAGATEKALNKLANSPGFQLGRLAAAAKVELLELGSVVLPMVTAAARFLADNLSLIVDMAKGAALGLAVLATPSLIAGLVAVKTAVVAMFTAMAANPIGLIVIALGITIGLLAHFNESIRFSSTGLATLGDVAAVVWERITAGLQQLVDFISPAFSAISDAAGGMFGGVTFSLRGIIEFAVNVTDRFVAVFAAAFTSVIQAGAALPGAFANFGAGMANAVISAVEFMANKAINGINAITRAVNGVMSALGGEAAAQFLGFSAQIGEIANLDLGRFEGGFRKGGAALGTAFTDGLQAGWDQTIISDTILGGLDSIVNEAETRAQNRAADQRLIALANGRSTDGTQTVDPTTGTPVTTPSTGSGGSGGASAKSALNDELSRENNLLKEQQSILEGLRQPLVDLTLKKEALNQLLANGQISTDEFSRAMRDLNVEITGLNNSIGGGLLNGLARIAQEANNIGQQMSDFVVGAFNSATDAIVEFAKTGQFNVRQFFQELFSQLLKLAANQLFSQLLGGLFGGGGLGGAGGILGGLLGFQNGGSAMVAGNNNSPDSQLVAFRATRGERVDVSTPGQQRNGGVGQGGGTTVVQSPPVNVVAQLSSGDVVGAFDNDEGETVIINMLHRNASTVRQIVQG